MESFDTVWLPRSHKGLTQRPSETGSRRYQHWILLCDVDFLKFFESSSQIIHFWCLRRTAALWGASYRWCLTCHEIEAGWSRVGIFLTHPSFLDHCHMLWIRHRQSQTHSHDVERISSSTNPWDSWQICELLEWDFWTDTLPWLMDLLGKSFRPYFCEQCIAYHEKRQMELREACTLARGLIPGERVQCAICGFQVQ